MMHPASGPSLFVVCCALLLVTVFEVHAGRWISWEQARDQTEPRPVSFDTGLVKDGKPLAAIAIPDGDAYKAAAERIRQAVVEKTGVQLPIVAASTLVEGPAHAFTGDVLQPVREGGRNLVLIGDLSSNLAIARLYVEWFAFEDAAYPGTGGHTVRTVVDPTGNGWNAVILGGPGPDETTAATDEFVACLEAEGDGLKAPFRFTVTFGESEFFTDSRNRINSAHAYISNAEFYLLDPESEEYSNAPRWHPSPGRELPVAYVCDVLYFYMICPGLFYGQTGDPWFAQQAGKGIDTLFERMDWVEAKRTAPFDDHYMVEGWLRAWQQVANSPHLTEQQRARGHRVMAFLAGQMAMYRIDPAAYGNTSERVLSRHVYSGRFAGDAMCRYVQNHSVLGQDIAGVISENRSNFSVMIDGMLGSYMTGFDHKWGLDGNWHLLQAAVEGPREDYITSGMARLTADYTTMCINNAGTFVNFGAENVGALEDYDAYQVLGRAETIFRDGRYQWWLSNRMKRHPYKMFIAAMNPLAHWHQTHAPAVEPKHLIGLNRLPLPRLIWEDWTEGRVTNFAGTPVLNKVPYEECFNKITFRDGLDPDDQYLMLDGLGGQVYSGNDANGISEYSRYGRPLLVQYTLRHEPYYQNTISVSKGNTVHPAGIFARLCEMLDTGDVSYVKSQVDPLSESTNTRHLFMEKGRYCLVIDDVVPHKSGEQLLTCNFRGFGEPTVDSESGTWRLDNPDADLHLQSVALPGMSPAPRLTTTVREVATRPDGTSLNVQMLREAVGRDFEAGERYRYANVFYGVRHGEQAKERAVALSADCVAVKGAKTIVYAVSGDGTIEAGELRIQAAAARVSSDSAELISVTGMIAGDETLLALDQPVTLRVDFASASCTAQSAKQRCVETIVWEPEWSVKLTADEMQAGVQLPNGSKLTASIPALKAAADSIIARAEATSVEPRIAQARTEGAGASMEHRELLAAQSPVVAFCRADLNGDGRSEFIGAREDGHLLAVDQDGQLLVDVDTGQRNLASVWAGPINGETLILCGSGSGLLNCYDAAGAQRWQYRNVHCGYGTRYDVYSINAGDFTGAGIDQLVLGCHGVTVLLDVQDGPRFLKSTEVHAHKVAPLQVLHPFGEAKGWAFCNTMSSGPVLVQPADGNVIFCWVRKWQSTAELLGMYRFGEEDWLVHAGFNGLGAGRLSQEKWEAGQLAGLWEAGSWYRTTPAAITGGVVHDLDGDGTPEILSVNEAGFLVCYTPTGTEMWQRLVPGPVHGIDVIDGPEGIRIAVAGSDPGVLVLDADGDRLGNWTPDSGEPVQDLWADGEALFALTVTGALVQVELP